MKPKRGCFNDWEVYIETDDGVRLNEYPADIEATQPSLDPTWVCYLETPLNPDKTFSIIVNKPSSSRIASDVCARFAVDGRHLAGIVVRTYRTGPHKRSEVYEKRNGSTCEAPLMFGKIETTDDDSIGIKDTKVLGELGQIKITLEKGASAGSSIIGGPQCTETLAGPVHEKSKKAMVDQTVRTGLGKPVDGRTFRTTDWKPQRPGRFDETFIFKYMSRQMLMARRIIDVDTPPPPPVRPAQKRRRESSGRSTPATILGNGDEEETRLARIQDLEAQLKALKNGKKVKIERKDRPTPVEVKKEKGAKKEKDKVVIDITSP